ncbi:MAG: hypothetical protein MUE36_06485 [Acidimicrobiales bacterium]|jgi:hypothetical protein|nr:hypothetical protein [Acidimicrobiales bacterium]
MDDDRDDPADHDDPADGRGDGTERRDAAEVGEDRTEFALDEWSVEDRELLDRLVVGEGIAHVWQGATIVVPAGAQFVVDELIDAVESGAVADPSLFPAADEGEDDPEWDGLDDDVDAQELLGGVFLAADRLRRRASDPEGVLALVDLSATMASMRLPFGFDPVVWDDLVRAATGLAAALTAEPGSDGDVGDERVEELADELRARLRPLV